MREHGDRLFDRFYAHCKRMKSPKQVIILCGDGFAQTRWRCGRLGAHQPLTINLPKKMAIDA